MSTHCGSLIRPGWLQAPCTDSDLLAWKSSRVRLTVSVGAVAFFTGCIIDFSLGFSDAMDVLHRVTTVSFVAEK